MPLVIADRVQETTVTAGTGTLTLAGAVTGYQSFSVIGNGNTTYYALTNGANWEIGVGTYSTTGPTLARTTILSSSNAGSPITLSGTSTVFCTYPAGRAVEKDAANNFTLDAGTATTAALAFQSGTNLTTATAGVMEYDGRVPYFTPIGTQRGLIPGMQYYRLNSAFTGANQTAAQSWFNGTGNLALTLSSSTVYNFEALIYHFKATASTSHIVRALFGGTATVNNILYHVTNIANTAAPPIFDTQISGTAAVAATAADISTAVTTAIYNVRLFSGTVSINAGGTFIPQYSLSAAPNAGYTTGAGSYFTIWPVGASGSNISVGTWA